MSVVTKESNPELYNALFPEDEIKEKMTIGKAKKILRGFLAKDCYYDTPLYYAIPYLLDYITNLQEENMKYDQCLTELTDNYKELQKELTNLQEENQRLKEENKHIFANVNDDQLLRNSAMIYAELQDYKTRNKKAIEDIDLLMSGRYYKNNTGYMAQPCCNLRLEIIKDDLQGKSDE